MSAGAPEAPKSNTKLLVGIGIGACVLIGCCGLGVLGLLFGGGFTSYATMRGGSDYKFGYSYYDANSGKMVTAKPEDECCCETIGDAVHYDYDTAKSCVETSGGRCTEDANCDE